MFHALCFVLCVCLRASVFPSVYVLFVIHCVMLYHCLFELVCAYMYSFFKKVCVCVLFVISCVLIALLFMCLCVWFVVLFMCLCVLFVIYCVMM